MKFLVDADLPRRTAELLRQHGHDAVDVRDEGLGAVPDGEIADYARSRGLCLMSGDFGFADIRNYPPERYPGIVVLQLPRDATAGTILAQVRSLLGREDVLSRLPGRLAIVGLRNVRLRPKP